MLLRGQTPKRGSDCMGGQMNTHPMIDRMCAGLLVVLVVRASLNPKVTLQRIPVLAQLNEPLHNGLIAHLRLMVLAVLRLRSRDLLIGTDTLCLSCGTLCYLAVGGWPQTCIWSNSWIGTAGGPPGGP